MAKPESRNFILTKKINDVLYQLMVKTTADMVYVDSRTTLTEVLSQVTDLLTEFKGSQEELENSFNSIVEGAPEHFSSFKEVWDYVNINGDPKSALIKMIESKQTAEEGKGLSTHDFDDLMYEKLKNGYSKEELDQKFEIIIDQNTKAIQDINERISNLEERPNVIMANSYEEATTVRDLNCWYHIISKDVV